MRAYLERAKQNKEYMSTGNNISRIVDILWPDFVYINECIFIKESYNKSHVQESEFVDKTSYEAFVNHIHLDQIYWGEPVDYYEVLQIALKVLDMWKIKLKNDCPNMKFILILSFNEEDCNLRFHRFRQNELPWINPDEIQKFEEGIMIVETN